MRTVVATTPSGAQWRVRVVWQPRWRAFARRFGAWRRRRRDDEGGGGLNLPDASGDDPIAMVIVGLILAGLLLWFLLLPLLLLVMDVLVVLGVLALAIPARVLLRRPWTIEAVSATSNGVEDRFTAQTVGWRRALALRDEIVRKLRDGHPAPVV